MFGIFLILVGSAWLLYGLISPMTIVVETYNVPMEIVKHGLIYCLPACTTATFGAIMTLKSVTKNRKNQKQKERNLV